MEIRQFKETDRRDVVNLWRECNLVVPWNDPDADINAKMNYQPGLFFVGILDGELIASAMGGYDGHRGSVFYLGVKKAYRRYGYGRQLMDYIAIELKKLGCPKININIRRNNLEVREFYEALGYKEDDVITVGQRLDTKN